MAEVRVETEEERANGWSFGVTVRADDRAVRGHTVTMAWVDYDFWCGGRAPPERVVRTVVELVLSEWAGEVPERFDASTARRWVEGLDRRMKGVV